MARDTVTPPVGSAVCLRVSSFLGERHMRKLRATLWCVLAAGGVGCATITPVPGSESVRTTRNPADITGCTAVGNVSVSDEVQQQIF
jgi:hypothetical protein